MSWDIAKDLKDLERRLGLSEGFLDDLYNNEDDWSFVIKLSAMVEASCTHTISTMFGYPELEECFAYLDQSNPRIGRVKLLKEIEVIYSNQAKILNALATLRNSVAHDVKNVNFIFSDYLNRLDTNQLNNFVTYFGNSVQDEVKINDKTYSRREFVLMLPKFSILSSVSEVMACLNLHIRDKTSANDKA